MAQGLQTIYGVYERPGSTLGMGRAGLKQHLPMDLLLHIRKPQTHEIHKQRQVSREHRVFLTHSLGFDLRVMQASRCRDLGKKPRGATPATGGGFTMVRRSTVCVFGSGRFTTKGQKGEVLGRKAVAGPGGIFLSSMFNVVESKESTI